MKAWRFDSPGPEASLEIAAELGRSIGEPGLAIGLIGPLGAGKTVFVKGLAAGLGVDARLVSSPTFVVAQQYPLHEGAGVLHHVDFYRLESELELESIGFDDMFERGAVLAVEWADRFPDALGADRLELEFDGPTIGGVDLDGQDGSSEAGRLEERAAPKRAVSVRAYGPEAERVLEDWAGRVARLESRREDRKAGTGGGGRLARATAEMWLLMVCLLAWGFAGSTPLARQGAGAVCTAPIALEADELGVRRVSCGPSPGAWPSEAGVGGLLFGQRIDLNRASPALLEVLPGIGPARARAIVEDRRGARFDRVSDLERIPGIGPKIRSSLEPWLRADSASAPSGRSSPGSDPIGHDARGSATRTHRDG